MTLTVVFANNKGGIGKSTLSTNLTAAWAQANPDKKILYVDLTFTRSISNLLLGDAPVSSMASTLDLLGTVKKRRDRARALILYSIPAMAGALYLLPLGLSVSALLSYFACVYFCVFRYAMKTVDPTERASASTLYPNLSVLVGGETLAHASKEFPWQMAAREWSVPASVDLVVIDIDNVLDDYARWALSVSTGIIVPASLNQFDFDRMCQDPRNNSLFDFVEQMNHPSLKYAAVIFNRVRCNADYQPDEENPDRAEFKIASSETTLRDQLARQFTTRIRNDHQVCLMRELPGRLLNMMMTQKRPIVSIENTPQVRDTLNAANKNLATIAAKVFG